jgi:outer membrane receptor protein involved in Fe transport
MNPNPFRRMRMAVTAAAAVLPTALLAQPGTPPAPDTGRVVLEPLVVTAERERSAPPPVATTRVSPQAVRRAQADNPYDLARRVAGIEVHDQGQGPGFASNTVIRGFTSDHSGDVLLVVDGVPVNLPIHGHGEGYADWNSLLPAAVSSFRVIHGAASPLYGDFALGGVAEIFTAADAAGTAGALSSSSYGDVGGWALTGRRGARGGSLAAMEVRRNEGWRSNSDYALVNGLLRGWRAVGAGRVEGGLALYGSDWSSPGFLSLADYNAERLRGATDLTDGGDTRRAVLHGRYAAPLGPRTSLQATAWGMLSEWNLFLNIPGEGEALSQTGESDGRHGAGGQAEVVWTPAAGEITLGVSGRADAAAYVLSRTAERRMTAAETSVDARHEAGAVYARWRRTLGGRLGLDLGGRVDVVRHASLDRLAPGAAWVDDVRIVASPKLGARWWLGDALSLRASTSRGFRSSVGVIDDPARAPILAWAHELGMDVQAGPVEASVALFRMDVSNERVLDPVTREISSAGSSVRQGIDADLRVRLLDGLHATAAATWNDARLVGRYADAHEEHEGAAVLVPAFSFAPVDGPHFHEGHDHALESERIPGVARYTGKLGVEAELPRGAETHLAWRFTGPYVPIGEPDVRSRAFSVLDVGASIPLGRRLVLDAELQNALGIRYAELRASGFVTPGAPRSLRASLRFDPGVF